MFYLFHFVVAYGMYDIFSDIADGNQLKSKRCVSPFESPSFSLKENESNANKKRIENIKPRRYTETSQDGLSLLREPGQLR